MPLPNHLNGCRQNPPGQTSSSPHFEHAITRQPNRTVYNVYSNKKRKEQTGEIEPAATTNYGQQQHRPRTDRSTRGPRTTARTASASPSTRCPTTNSRTRSATPIRPNNAIMSRSAGTGCQTVANAWIPSAGRFNTSPRTYYSRARTLEAERQAALAAASMTSSSPPKIRTTITTKTSLTTSTSSVSTLTRRPSESTPPEPSSSLETVQPVKRPISNFNQVGMIPGLNFN